MTFIPTIVGSGASAFSYLQRTRDAQEQQLRTNSVEQRDLTAVRDRLRDLTSADQLLEDRQVLRVVLTSFGLEGDLDNRAFLRNVLNSDPNAPGSFANRLADERYSALARSFNFGGFGGATFPGASAKDTLSAQFQTLTSVDDLFDPANQGLFFRALEVFGLESDVRRPTILRQVLESDLSDPNSIANRLDDPKYIEFAQAFQNEPTQLASILRGRVSDQVAEQLGAIETPAELVSNSRLLRVALSQFDLEDMATNTTFLEEVLASDINDPNSFANSLSDSRFAELAATFNFADRQAQSTSIYAFGALAAENEASLTNADAFLANEDLVAAALDLFDLPNTSIDSTFLKQILEADTDDPESFVNRADNTEYLAFSKAFGFGDRLINPGDETPTRIERLITAVEARPGQPQTVDAFFEDTRLYFAALNLFDLPFGTRELNFTRLALSSDEADPFSAINVAPNPGYRLLRDGLNLDSTNGAFSYPAGFEDAIINEYVSRQFEISVGQVDSSMRLLLSLERDLSGVVEGASSNDARWFQILGSPSLRQTFEGALGLPSTIGQIDVEQQLGVFKDRAEQRFGTSDVATLLQTANLEEVQRRYLGSVAVAGTGGFAIPSPAANVLSILA